MLETRKLLKQLIEKAAAERGCNEEQTKMIQALVRRSMDEELPEVSELRAILKAIGGG